MKPFVLVLFSFWVAVPHFASSAPDRFNPSVKDAVKVEVLNYPEEILTRTAVTPRLLNAAFKRRKVIELHNAGEWISLHKALLKTEWVPSKGNGDYRWALLIHTKTGATKVYIDRRRRLATTDQGEFSVRGGVLEWLKSQW